MQLSLFDEIRMGMRHPMFLLGVRDCLPLALGVAAWGLVTGAALSASTLSWQMAVFMTMLVCASAPQLAVLPLIAVDAPMSSILAMVVCTNLRYIVFSLHYRPYFCHLVLWRRLAVGYFIGDVAFALFGQRFSKPESDKGQVHYFMGGSVFCCLLWQAGVVLGLVGGQSIPASWGMGFAGTMALLALTCGQLRDTSTQAAALIAAGAAVAAYDLPMRLNIVVAVAAALIAGLIVERTRLRA